MKRGDAIPPSLCQRCGLPWVYEPALSGEPVHVVDGSRQKEGADGCRRPVPFKPGR